MPFEVIWTKRSKKDLKLIDRTIAARIVEKVEALGNNEIVFLEKAKGTPYYKYRVGKYRVLIKKFPATKKLFIMRARHRKKIYKNI